MTFGMALAEHSMMAASASMFFLSQLTIKMNQIWK